MSTNLHWKISNYSEFPCGERVRSPSFTISSFSCSLELRRNRKLELRLNGMTSTPGIWCKVGVVDPIGHEHFTATKVTSNKKEDNEKVFWTVQETDLNRAKMKYLPDDILTISFKCTVQDVQPSGEATASSFMETLSNDLGRFLDGKTNTDCVLLAGNSRFPAHLSVLAARSAVFEAMPNEDSPLVLCKEVEIQDAQPHEVEEILHYIYTGKIPKLTAGIAFPMYELAEKYALPELKEECLKLITSNLTVVNVCAAAFLAVTRNVEPLKRAAIAVVQSKLTEVIDSDQWIAFSTDKPDIANNILFEALTATKTKFNR